MAIVTTMVMAMAMAMAKIKTKWLKNLGGVFGPNNAWTLSLKNSPYLEVTCG
jgi:hypothetical protein